MLKLNLIKFLLIVLTTAAVCDPLRSKRYVGGKEATPLKWPSQVLIVSKYDYYDVCGGTLISENWVLTAAHCVMDNPNEKPSDFKIILGEHNREEKEGTEIRRNIEKVFPHPNYEMQNYSFDVALLQLDYSVDFDEHKHLKPICLDLIGVNVTNKKCVGTGWGIMDQAENLPDILQELEMKEFDHTNCSLIHELRFKNEASKEKVTDMHICMVTERKSLLDDLSDGGSCGGDSGGPLQCFVNSRWMQVGITWSGTHCLTKPSVYNLVHKYAQFIVNVTNYQQPPHCLQETEGYSKFNVNYLF